MSSDATPPAATPSVLAAERRERAPVCSDNTAGGRPPPEPPNPTGEHLVRAPLGGLGGGADVEHVVRAGCSISPTFDFTSVVSVVGLGSVSARADSGVTLEGFAESEDGVVSDVARYGC